MLTFAAIVPHPPVLIPSIGKENIDKLKKTIRALDILEEELNQANPDTIIVIYDELDVIKMVLIHANTTIISNLNIFL